VFVRQPTADGAHTLFPVRCNVLGQKIIALVECQGKLM